MTSTPTLWLLIDDKASHRSQVMGVAERLGLPFVEKSLRYNHLAGLANGPFGARLWHLTGESKAALCPPRPDLVIAAGRRSAPVALSFKKHSPATKIIQLMWPDVSPRRFDLIALPEHDTAHTGSNILRTFGALHSITPAKLTAESRRWQKQAARLPSPRIALLIGGTSPSMRFEPADFKALAAYASAEAERLGGSLLVTTSPRTGEAAEALIKPLLVAPHLFHAYRAGGDNPYLGYLGLADAIIVTGDSNSMCSEAVATGKPVYIFTPPHLARDSASFREQLFARGIAKHHTYAIRTDWQPALMPDAAQEVADAIKKLDLLGNPLR